MSAYCQLPNQILDDVFYELINGKNVVLVGPAKYLEGSKYGESIDIVPTISNLLGFDVDIPSSLLPGKVLNDVFI